MLSENSLLLCDSVENILLVISIIQLSEFASKSVIPFFFFFPKHKLW